MLVRQVDATHLLLAGQDHDHDLRRLNEIHRLGQGSEQESGNPNRPATCVRERSGLAGKDKLVALAQDLPRPGLQDWSAEIGELLRRLPSGHPEFVIGTVWMRGVLLHGTGTARRWDELAVICVPSDACIGREIGWRALSHR